MSKREEFYVVGMAVMEQEARRTLAGQARRVTEAGLRAALKTEGVPALRALWKELKRTRGLRVEEVEHSLATGMTMAGIRAAHRALQGVKWIVEA